MGSTLKAFEEKVIIAVVQEIEELIKLEYLTDAIEKLFDFIRDFTASSPKHRTLMRNALQLSARHARYQKARRHRLPEPEPQQILIDELINQTEEVAKLAKLIGNEEQTLEEKEEVVEVINKQIQSNNATGYSATDLKRLFIKESQNKNPLETQIIAKIDSIERSYIKDGFKLGPVSFELRKGEITGVVGMNASGKTTMLRCLLQELKPDSGTVTFPALEKEKLDWFSIKGKSGYVAQLPERWAGRLRSNLNYTASAYGLTGKANDDLVDWYMHRYGLKTFENARWDEISGGFKIRFELVRALLTRPKLLVLDEPLAYLDIVTQQMFLHDLRSIATSVKNPIPIMVTSQHLHEIEVIADRMVILDDGKCLYSGPTGKMPINKEFDMFEVEIKVKRAELLTKLRPAGLVDLEKTSLGWILIFEKPKKPGSIQRALLENFGSSMEYYRNITKSTRSLFRNHRDDFEHGIY